MSRGLLLIGYGSLFEAVSAQTPGNWVDRTVEELELTADDAMSPPEGLLEPYAPQDWDVLAAVGQDGMNFIRLALFSHAKQRGFKFESFIHSSAVIDPTAKIGENCFVAENAVVGPHARVGYNTVIGARSILGVRAVVDTSAWIGAACTLGATSRVGANSVVDAGVIIADGVSVGKQVVLQIARTYDRDVPDRTYHHSLFDRPVRIYA